MDNKDRVKAMGCFGNLVTYVEQDPDPLAQDKYQEKFNCRNCDYHKYCCKLAETLEGGKYDLQKA